MLYMIDSDQHPGSYWHPLLKPASFPNSPSYGWFIGHGEGIRHWTLKWETAIDLRIWKRT